MSVIVIGIVAVAVLTLGLFFYNVYQGNVSLGLVRKNFPIKLTILTLGLAIFAYFQSQNIDTTELDAAVAELTECCSNAGLTPDDIKLRCNIKEVGGTNRSARLTYSEYIKLVPESCKGLFEKAYDAEPAVDWIAVAVVSLLITIAYWVRSSITSHFERDDIKAIEMTVQQDVTKLENLMGGAKTDEQRARRNEYEQILKGRRMQDFNATKGFRDLL